VQDALEAALAAIAGEPVAVSAAGRTDRGVHARAHVGHLET
jgi:tRNA pseudouridine38-40 synthase